MIRNWRDRKERLHFVMKLNHCMDEDLSKTESKKESTSVYGEAVRVFSRPQRVQASVSAPKGVYVFILWLPEGKDTKTTLTWMQKPQKKKPKTPFSWL